MPQSYFGNIIKQMPLTHFEKEVIYGCLLGDGTLTQSGKHYRLRIEHAFFCKDYVSWKFQLLNRLCVADVQYVSHHNSMRFGTVGHPQITEMRKAWYNPIKQIPNTLKLTPLMLAIWFMDDGTKHRDTVDISVHSFSPLSISYMRDQLLGYNIKTTENSDGKGKRLYILKSSYPNFKELVKPYTIKCMAYKLP